ncbi:hypothetical protein BE17_14385 [Sorangium cellulosum]|uniref:Uncharacterized protein n=1 Tax=Sorangium cellulosum TaxID=56 RepID=A0A150R774_SORCE|nr:hypothetical protein BE17_14385 [Sorangium cellulosum]
MLFGEHLRRYLGRTPRRLALVSEHGYSGKRELPDLASVGIVAVAPNDPLALHNALRERISPVPVS